MLGVDDGRSDGFGDICRLGAGCGVGGAIGEGVGATAGPGICVGDDVGIKVGAVVGRTDMLGRLLGIAVEKNPFSIAYSYAAFAFTIPLPYLYESKYVPAPNGFLADSSRICRISVALHVSGQ